MSDNDEQLEEYGIVAVAIGLLAYMIENEEPVAVKMETVQMLFDTVVANGRVPQFVVQESEDGQHLKIGTLLVDGEDDANQ